MKSIKGGYQLISLGMVALGSLTALPSGELAKISATTKRIVLTDITLDGSTRLPDIEVQIEKSGTDILLKGIYGKDLKIESDGDVVVSTHSEFRLYQHQISVTGGYLQLILKDSTKITSYNVKTYLPTILNGIYGEMGTIKRKIIAYSLSASTIRFFYYDVTQLGELPSELTTSYMDVLISDIGTDNVIAL